MTASGQGATHVGPVEFLAAERTQLAWLRTGLALMGFGFVVGRLGLFLQQIQGVPPSSLRAESVGLSLWFGVALAMYLVAVRPSRTVGHVAREEVAMDLALYSGIINTLCHHSVDETASRLSALLQAQGVTLFALVDHSGEAAKVGMQMRPTKLLIFGNPKAGTPLMLAAPGSAIDLPLKVLVWEDDQGRAWASYNSPAYLQERHRIPEELLSNIAVVEALVARATT